MWIQMTNTQTFVHAQTQTQTQTHAHEHTHACTHTHAHTHTLLRNPFIINGAFTDGDHIIPMGFSRITKQ